MQILKTAQSSVRDDLSRKLMNELEERLLLSEKEKLKITQQKDKLQSKLDQILNDISKL